MAKISIIVPVYNTGIYLNNCLDSLIKQSHEDIEIIVVNDGSTDNSLDILKEIQQKDKRIVILDLENQGPSGARNEGLKVAKGKYIMFVDSDDWISEDTCEKALESLKVSNADTVLFNYISESSSVRIEKRLFQGGDRVFNEKEVYEELFCGVLGLTSEKLKRPEQVDVLVSVWAKLYNTEIIKQNNIQFIDLKLVPSECQLFNLEYMQHAKKAIYLDECLYRYRRNNITSFTKHYREDLFDKWLYWTSYVEKFLKLNQHNSKAYDAYYSRICFSIIPLSGNSLKRKKIKSTYNEIKKILNNPIYIEAYKRLDYSYFPMHWKIYFKLCKWRIVSGVYFMSKVMRTIIDARKK